MHGYDAEQHFSLKRARLLGVHLRQTRLSIRSSTHRSVRVFSIHPILNISTTRNSIDISSLSTVRKRLVAAFYPYRSL